MTSTPTENLLLPRDVVRLHAAAFPQIDAAQRDTMGHLADTLFFASLLEEEGHPVALEIVWLPGGAEELAGVTTPPQCDVVPGPTWDVIRFADRKPVSPESLRRVSRGLQYGRHRLVIGGTNRELRIDGIAIEQRASAFSDNNQVVHLAAPRPGVVVFAIKDREVLRIDRGHVVLPGPGPFGLQPVGNRLRDLLCGTDGRPTFEEMYLSSLVRQVRATRAGGMLALLGNKPSEDLLNSVQYRLADPLVLSRRLSLEYQTELVWSEARHQPDQSGLREAQWAAQSAIGDVVTAIEVVARLSAIDGAILVGPRFEVYGAGYIVASDVPLPPVFEVPGNDVGAARPAVRLGARHAAGCRFVATHEGSVAFVISEDGPVSCVMAKDGRVLKWRVWFEGK